MPFRESAEGHIAYLRTVAFRRISYGYITAYGLGFAVFLSCSIVNRFALLSAVELLWSVDCSRSGTCFS